MSAVLGPNKDLGTGEQEAEQKSPLSQTWQLEGLVEEVQAEQGVHDEAEEQQIQRQYAQSTVGTLKAESHHPPGTPQER